VDDSHKHFEDALRAGAYESAWRYCCRLTSTYEDAQDLLQESVGIALGQFSRLRDRARFKPWLLAIVRSRFLRLRDRARFKPWLLAIVRSRFLMQLRSRKLTVPLEEELVGQIEGESDPESEALLALLRALPASQREVLELFYLHDLSLRELGSVLGVPAIAARHRLHRAREALRRAAIGKKVIPMDVTEV
jgi:RNA polymerase sigma factor (sigma-70 family)